MSASSLNTGPDVGWFAYVPLSGPDFAPGKRADIWAQMITFTELSALAVAVEVIVHRIQNARSWHVIEPDSAVCLGDS